MGEFGDCWNGGIITDGLGGCHNFYRSPRDTFYHSLHDVFYHSLRGAFYCSLRGTARGRRSRGVASSGAEQNALTRFRPDCLAW